MKKTILSALFCVLCASALITTTGCKTVNPGQPTGALSADTNGIVYIGSWQVKTNDVYNSIKLAATIGTQQGVKADSNSVPYFQLVQTVLTAALASGQYDPAIISAALGNISIAEVRANPGLANGVNLGLTLYGAFWGQAVAQKIGDASPYLTPALTALRDGIAAGLPQ
jgi:hypothetical protein